MAAANVEVDAEDENVGHTFDERRRSYFQNLLHKKWAYSRKDHTVCVPTEDGHHFELSDRHILFWVDALCEDRATTVNPPYIVFVDIAGGAVWNRKNGTYTVRAVSIPPSREHCRRPVGSCAGSINNTFDVRTDSCLSNLDRSMSNACSSSGTTAAFGPGYINSKAIGWLGRIVVKGINLTMDHNLSRSHISCLEKWEKHQLVLGDNERSQVLKMLKDALHMSMPWHSTTVNDYGYNIGRSVYHLLRTYRDIPETNYLALWHIKVQVSLLPILLTKVSREDTLASDLTYLTLAALKRSPFAVQGIETSATVIETSAIIIRLVARELAYTQCTFLHSWLGIWLLRVVEMSLRVRKLSYNEIRAIKELVIRRQEHNLDYNAEQECAWRPWEAPLFAHCASQDAWFKEAVLGARGLASLVFALNCMLSEEWVSQIRWEAVGITLRALAFLCEHKWVAAAVDPATIRSLLQVLRLSVPERWFCIRFWAADTIRNIVAHCPQLARVLLEEGAVPAFEALSKPELDRELSADPTQLEIRRRQIYPVPPVPPPPSHNSVSSPEATSPEHDPNLRSSELHLGSGNRRFLRTLMCHAPGSWARHERNAPAGNGREITHPHPNPSRNDSTSAPSSQRAPRNSRPSPSLIQTPAQARLLEDYKVEAAKRAKELAEYVRKWTEYTQMRYPRWNRCRVWRFHK